MKIGVKDMEIAKRRVFLLKGEKLRLYVNEGRNKIVEYNGTIEDTYAGIFTVREENDKVHSYPYSDVLTKNIKFYRGEE